MKKGWKKLTASILVLVMTLMLAACGGSSDNGSSDNGADSSSGEENVEINLLSHRYAALEYYAQAMVDNAPDNVTVNAELTTYDDWQEKMTLNLSSESSAYDITYISRRILQHLQITDG